MKGYWLTLWTIAVVLLVVAPSEGPAHAQAEFRIGLVTDIGPIDDRSFNQSAWEGVQMVAEKLGGFADFIETTDPEDYANNLRLFADQDFDVIVSVGFALGDATLEAAQQYPETHFIMIDVDAELLMASKGVRVPNVTGLIFREDQIGFLTGFLAARLTRSGIIGAVLPADLPPVVRFREGFEFGARYAKPDIRILASYHPGGLTVAFDDPAWGAQTAAQAMDQGADVIFSGGGKTGNGGLQEVARRTKPDDPRYCIGVDTDQWFSVPEAQPCLVTSGIKRIPEGVVAIVDKLLAGELTEPNFVGAVDLAPFHDFEDVIPEQVKAELRQLRADLAEGRLKIDGTRP
ncbi:MAG: BMP family ABC transporter substrate-binding protein [Candidatus Thermofonsia Clade 1 bacterium]|jgi:basic membrane protein A|uniref:BMP family ABC transporter substrate-binding protein n=1 Tax=Candidatus Thermofonsia Clade 1 bacterium TaxID=2364210 RepID=A0A2M8PZZ0_9CHLR|nr:MAG: BMP family ABC transporter substrate-binding protein [Candidatus Thermofonsia Clade 1 bacterium]PJF43116.1 MAG: BMP family ABC transporter substrate-binding protein [Candidatus Thermofonsia Clade 1 bacterium]RMF51940.1 MAG: BMP family ABC transporter substrate-binding protein [Chloroflexota bacterium]